MENDGRQAHWEKVYTSKGENEVSWFQESPAPSLALIAQVGAAPSAAIIDIGGGASRLVDELLDRRFHDVTVLDLSAAALEAAKARLGERANQAHWLVADATTWDPSAHVRRLARPGGISFSDRRARPSGLHREAQTEL